MKNKGELASPSESPAWTRPEDYLGTLARRRTERRKREPKPRTQPERPRLLLSTLPFVLVITALAVIAVGIMILAFPGTQPQHREHQLAQERGYAPKGWFQKAEKQFR